MYSVLQRQPSRDIVEGGGGEQSVTKYTVQG